MARCFKQLSFQDRLIIDELLNQKKSRSEIAKLIGVHRSTITRELNRNWWRSNRFLLGYTPTVAQEMTKARRQRPLKLSREYHQDLKQFVIELLQLTWSPAQIAGFLKMRLGYCTISHEAIYRYIFSEEGKKLNLYKHLRSRKKRRFKQVARKNKPILNRTSIQERPHFINDRSDFGHWEADLMLFRRGSQCNLLTLRERQTRYVIAIKTYSKQAEEILRGLNYVFRIRQSDLPIKSLILDNGTEWAEHRQIAEKLGTKVYFCEPYKSYQKGSIENANFFLREFFPREIPIDKTSNEYIEAKVELLNRRPMQCLGYLSPEKLFYQLIKAKPSPTSLTSLPCS